MVGAVARDLASPSGNSTKTLALRPPGASVCASAGTDATTRHRASTESGTSEVDSRDMGPCCNVRWRNFLPVALSSRIAKSLIS